MNTRKTLVLVFGPFPIFGLSMALTHWARPEGRAGSVTNQVLMASAEAGEPSTPGESADRTRHPLRERCQSAAKRLSERLGEACQVIVRPPLVLAGDMPAEALTAWHDDTIAPAAEAMRNCYVRIPPSEPITVFLFSDQASYNHYSKQWFNERDVSIYGYYKPDERTLVMNIATGGGTLVHELTHALLAFDFPEAPDWFNEGLASLHEQCRFRSGDQGPWIEGLENWRLPGLQSSIRKQRLRSLRSLVTADDFRGREEGSNYAQARYLCLFLQRQHKLETFYREFRARRRDDPRGEKTLLAQFPGESWDSLDREFQAWALELKP